MLYYTTLAMHYHVYHLQGKMEVLQTKVEMMQDEQSHRRKVEMALAARSTVSPKPIGELVASLSSHGIIVGWCCGYWIWLSQV